MYFPPNLPRRLQSVKDFTIPNIRSLVITDQNIRGHHCASVKLLCSTFLTSSTSPITLFPAPKFSLLNQLIRYTCGEMVIIFFFPILSYQKYRAQPHLRGSSSVPWFHQPFPLIPPFPPILLISRRIHRHQLHQQQFRVRIYLEMSDQAKPQSKCSTLKGEDCSREPDDYSLPSTLQLPIFHLGPVLLSVLSSLCLSVFLSGDKAREKGISVERQQSMYMRQGHL